MQRRVIDTVYCRSFDFIGSKLVHFISDQSNYVNHTKSGLAITSIILASIGIPGLILFGYGGILGLIGLIFGIAAVAEKGGVVEKRTRRLVVWGIVLSGIVLLFGLLILSMWIG